jgi:lysophospholipase L1-like esterase
MKTILCYGDSNTHGTAPLAHWGDIRRFGFNERWTGVMRHELGAGYHIIEEGLPGRTTVRDDPVEGAYKNGRTHLPVVLDSHLPIDLVVLMLGTNDLKKRFSTNAAEIAFGAQVLVQMILSSQAGPKGSAPKVLLMCPPPLARLEFLAGMFEGGDVTSQQMAAHYAWIAQRHGCAFLDAGKVIVTSDVDGVHFDLEEHTKLGKAVAAKVQEILG